MSCTMQCIIYIIMKRTPLYLDEDIARILSAVSRQQGRTVSELVRECVREKFGEEKRKQSSASTPNCGCLEIPQRSWQDGPPDSAVAERLSCGAPEG